MWRNDFPLLREQPVVWLDNASSTQKPTVVLQTMDEFYRQSYANVHRGLYRLSEAATEQYEAVRDQVQQWLGAGQREEIIFTSGTTTSLNLVAAQLGKLLLQPGDVILLTPMEHHSNLVPWQLAAQRYGAALEFVDLTMDDQIDLTTLPQKFHERVKIMALAHISNAAGTVHPIAKIIAEAHKHNVPVVIDAAQSVGHVPVNVPALDCDFLACSGHKMCGPTGVGVLYGKRAWLERLEPWQGGGDMIRTVALERSTWADLPHKFEAGTPNSAGVIGLGAAITYLQSIGLEKIQHAIQALSDELFEQLRTLDFVKLYGPRDAAVRHGIVSFNVGKIHAHDVAQLLDEYNIAVRAGHHCAQPLLDRWQVPATVRASIYFYNTTADIDQLISALKKVYKRFQ